jgi:hypothetical protein
LFPLAVTIENARRATLLISYYLDFGKVATDVARGAAASLRRYPGARTIRDPTNAHIRLGFAAKKEKPRTMPGLSVSRLG